MVVHHTGRVVHRQADLILPLAGLRPPQPDLVLAELAGDVGDDFAHVEPLPGAEISSEIRQYKWIKTRLTTGVGACGADRHD